MSNNNTLGGFFLEVGVNTNKGSFEVAQKSIIGVGNSVLGLLGTVRNAVPMIAEQLNSLGKSEAAGKSLATTLGMSTEELDSWRIAAGRANTDANSLISSMSQMDHTLKEIKNGHYDKGLAENLSRLGINMTDLSQQDVTQRMSTIFNAAKGMKDQQQAYTLIGDILGNEAVKMYQYLGDSNQSMDELLNYVSKFVLTTDETAAKAAGFSSEWTTTLEAIKQIKSLFGAEFADKLTPMLEKLNNWFAKNGNSLGNKIANLAGSLGELIIKIGDATAPTIVSGIQDFSDAWEIFQLMINGDVKGAVAKSKVFEQKMKEKIGSAINKKNEELTGRNQENQLAAESLVAKVREETYGYKFWENGGKLKWSDLTSPQKRQLTDLIPVSGNEDWWTQYFSTPINEIHDGIISPGGHITKVDQNDWVLAAKDLGNIASAFIPQNYMAAQGGSYIINQTFNVSGTSDLPETIRQQAYKGTEQGLLDTLRERQTRLQLMPGLA